MPTHFQIISYAREKRYTHPFVVYFANSTFSDHSAMSIWFAENIEHADVEFHPRLERVNFRTEAEAAMFRLAFEGA